MLIGLLSVCIVSASCGKEEDVPKCDTCFINMYINGISWQADYVRTDNVDPDFFNLQVHGSDSFNQIRESMSFGRIPIELGSYNIVDWDIALQKNDLIAGSFTTLLAHGDVIGAKYRIYNEEENILVLESIDLENDFIEGRFQLSLIKTEDPDPSIEYPDTVRIRRGVFRSDIWRG